MNTQERCPHCNASMKRFWHKMTPGMVVALLKMNRAINLKKSNDINVGYLSGELKFTHTERCNWQKLRLHGLVARVRFLGEVKRGRWLITRKGYKFLQGEMIPQRVLSFRNRVEGHSTEIVNIEDVLRSSPHFEGIEDIRFEYAEPIEDGEIEVTGSTAFPKKRKLKKGQTPCPKCGAALRRNTLGTPVPGNPNTLDVKRWDMCTECEYDSRSV